MYVSSPNQTNGSSNISPAQLHDLADNAAQPHINAIDWILAREHSRKTEQNIHSTKAKRQHATTGEKNSREEQKTETGFLFSGETPLCGVFTYSDRSICLSSAALCIVCIEVG